MGKPISRAHGRPQNDTDRSDGAAGRCSGLDIANTAWLQAGLEPITPHEARHCAISHFIAAGLDWKQTPPGTDTALSARPGTATGTSSPGDEEQARERWTST
jgi:hypothetical protein